MNTELQQQLFQRIKQLEDMNVDLARQLDFAKRPDSLFEKYNQMLKERDRLYFENEKLRKLCDKYAGTSKARLGL